MREEKRLLQHAVQFATPRAWSSLLQLLWTALCFGGAWWCALRTAETSAALSLLGSVVAGVFMLRLFIIQHDCGHGSFFTARWANDALGLLLGVVTLASYYYWRRTHALHHGATSRLDTRKDPGYLLLWTVAEYRAASPRARWAYRLYRNMWLLALLGVPFQYLLKHRYPWDIPRTWQREWWSVAFTNAALFAVGAIGPEEFQSVPAPCPA